MAEYLLWLDVETSGLDSYSCALLEVAAIVTDRNLVKVTDGTQGEISMLCELPSDLSIAEVDQKVLAMHIDSGLWEACRKGGHTPSRAIEELVNWACRSVPTRDATGTPTTLHLAGRSVHFDLAWIIAKGPIGSVARLRQRLHHRRFDVSSVKMFARMVGLEVPDLPEHHRALPDLRDDIELTRHLWHQVRKLHPESLHHCSPR